jgi:hypothetical protein
MNYAICRHSYTRLKELSANENGILLYQHKLNISEIYFARLTEICNQSQIFATHGNTYYKKSFMNAKFISPVWLSIEPVRRILVASFKNDPEIEMIEPQVFGDAENGKGLRVLVYRRDKKVDVYWEPGVKFDEGSFNIGAGPGVFRETAMSPAKFEITGRGVDIDIAFNDSQNRRIELRILENNPTDGSFPFLAPVGNDIEHPRLLFLVYMHGFDFVVRKGCLFHCKIGERELKPDFFPIPRNGRKVYFARYARKPVIGEINADSGKAPVFECSIPGKAKSGEMEAQIGASGGIESLSAGSGDEQVRIQFLPACPNLADLPQQGSASGHWTYFSGADEITGGNYKVSRDGQVADAALDVNRNWKPRNLPLSFKLFTRLVSSFRTWPTTYRWKATISLDDGSIVNGGWERKKI